MLDICMLGCAGMVPLPDRWLSSLYVSSDGHACVIDTGEGTQIAIREAGVRAKIIDTICLTHLHQDHVGGIAGLLLAMSNAGRTEDVTLIGPPGTSAVVESLIIAATPSFPIMAYECDGQGDQFYCGSMEIHPFPVEHVIPCLGYRLSLPRAGRFDPEKARSLGVPVTAWSLLQKGETIKNGDHIVRPEDVIGPARQGLCVVYATDTRPTDSIVRAGKGANLIILDANYESQEKAEKAKHWGHMTFPQAAELAKEAGAKELWLTHFSQSIANPERFLNNASSIFPNVKAGRNGLRTILQFPKDE